MQRTSATNSPKLIPENDVLRLEALRRYSINYERSEQEFDEITKMMQLAFGVDTAFVNLVEEERVYFKSVAGNFPLKFVDRSDSLCSLTVVNQAPTIFEDAINEPSLAHSKYVQMKEGIRFYAGLPLITDDGFSIGTVCLVHGEKRKFTDENLQLLYGFRSLVMKELQTRFERIGRDLKREQEEYYNDISRKEIAAAELAFRAELENKVDERTKELLEANESLRKKNDELDQFAYVASHDLQEPLRKVLIFNDIIQERFSVEPGLQVYLNRITDASQRMNGLIKSLLDYSRMGSLNSRAENVDLNAIFEQVLQDFDLLIEQKQASVVSDNLPIIKAQKIQMNQLFFNLIGNALKFTRAGQTPLIEVKSAILNSEEAAEYGIVRSSGKHVLITIKDNGIGFQQEFAYKVFTIFQRLNDRSRFGGYGIGLALCKKIVDNHGGIISATGKPGEGAEFNILLPTGRK